MHIVDEREDMINRRGRKNPVPKIEDVPWSAASLIYDALDVFVDHFAGRKEHDWVQIPLDRAFVPDRAPRLIQLNVEIHPEHTPSGLPKLT